MMHPNDARDARLTEYLDRLDERGRAPAGPASGADASANPDAAKTPDVAEFDALDVEDPELAEALEQARSARDLLRDLPRRPAPRDFVRKTQRRLRRRSGGRFFHPAAPPPAFRIQVELFAVVAVAIMAACYLFVAADTQRGVEPLVEEPVLESGATP